MRNRLRPVYFGGVFLSKVLAYVTHRYVINNLLVKVAAGDKMRS